MVFPQLWQITVEWRMPPRGGGSTHTPILNPAPENPSEQCQADGCSTRLVAKTAAPWQRRHLLEVRHRDKQRSPSTPVANSDGRRHQHRRLCAPIPALMQQVPGTAMATQVIGPNPMISPQRLCSSGYAWKTAAASSGCMVASLPTKTAPIAAKNTSMLPAMTMSGCRPDYSFGPWA